MIDIYLAAPYSHSSPEVKHQRFLKINEVAAQLMRDGHIVFSPISHAHQIALDHDLPTDWQYWQRSCETFVGVSKKVVVIKMEGWETSTGVTAEINLARNLNIPVEFYDI